MQLPVTPWSLRCAVNNAGYYLKLQVYVTHCSMFTLSHTKYDACV